MKDSVNDAQLLGSRDSSAVVNVRRCQIDRAAEAWKASKSAKNTIRRAGGVELFVECLGWIAMHNVQCVRAALDPGVVFELVQQRAKTRIVRLDRPANGLDSVEAHT